MFWAVITKVIQLMNNFWPAIAALAGVKLVMDMIFSAVYKRGRLDV